MQGVRGETGAAGLPGATGEKVILTSNKRCHVQGVRGETGAAGLPGATGEKGDPGITGSPGPLGMKGSEGPPGSKVTGDCAVSEAVNSNPESASDSVILYTIRYTKSHFS